ncbi:hypothetical protein THAOC_06304, partial [Thalassiosira oceanica]
CPVKLPGCEIVAANVTTEAPLVTTQNPPSLVGGDYCVWGPDNECYETGWPSCCGSEDVKCPEERPGCEIVATDVTGDDVGNGTTSETKPAVPETPTLKCELGPDVDGTSCGADEYCKLDTVGACAESNVEVGVCTTMPMMCTFNYLPVFPSLFAVGCGCCNEIESPLTVILTLSEVRRRGQRDQCCVRIRVQQRRNTLHAAFGRGRLLRVGTGLRVLRDGMAKLLRIRGCQGSAIFWSRETTACGDRIMSATRRDGQAAAGPRMSSLLVDRNQCPEELPGCEIVAANVTTEAPPVTTQVQETISEASTALPDKGAESTATITSSTPIGENITVSEAPVSEAGPPTQAPSIFKLDFELEPPATPSSASTLFGFGVRVAAIVERSGTCRQGLHLERRSARFHILNEMTFCAEKKGETRKFKFEYVGSNATISSANCSIPSTIYYYL